MGREARGARRGQENQKHKILCPSRHPPLAQLSGRYSVDSARLKPLYQRIKTGFPGIAAAHVLRPYNRGADLLANLAQVWGMAIDQLGWTPADGRLLTKLPDASFDIPPFIQDALEVARCLVSEARASSPPSSSCCSSSREAIDWLAAWHGSDSGFPDPLPDRLIHYIKAKQPALLAAALNRCPSSSTAEAVLAAQPLSLHPSVQPGSTAAAHPHPLCLQATVVVDDEHIHMELMGRDGGDAAVVDGTSDTTLFPGVADPEWVLSQILVYMIRTIVLRMTDG